MLLDVENPELPASAAAARLVGQVEVLCVYVDREAALCNPAEASTQLTTLRLTSAEDSYVDSQGQTVTIPARDGSRAFPSGTTNKVFDVFSTAQSRR